VSDQLPLHIAAKAVVVDPATNRALILRLNAEERAKKGRDEWHLPGGVRDDVTETLPDAARREVREESGIENTKVIGLVDYGEWQAFYEGDPARFLALIFELEVQGTVPDVTVSHEHTEAAWVGLDNIDTYPALFPEAKAWIVKVLQRRAAANG
jgi:ADP-ribose pyrophosphatase YjhB (NUDIX family)